MIVLTGADRAELDDQFIEMGAADFLPKSELAPALLERTIRHALERKQSEIRLARMVKQDALTGLGNRQWLEENMERAIARSQRRGARFAIIFLDLDRFKEVNDTLGHHVGDLLLVLVADRLQRATRDSDFVARASGDEFTLLLDDIHGAGDAALVAGKLLEAVRAPTPIHEMALNVTASLGIACYPDNGDTPMELMQKADMALYESKKSGSGHYRFFTDDMQARLENNLTMEQGLRRALQNDELELTEDVFIDTGPEMTALLGDIKALGCSVAIDDFGTGYSSMRYLKHFRVDRLKIDKSFVSGSGPDIAEPAITTAIMNLARSLDLGLVAEGVETTEQARFLLDNGCQTAQGFLVARPMPIEELFTQLRHGSHRDLR